MDNGTVVRTVSLVLVWGNVWLEKAGLNTIPFLSEEEIALGLTMIVSIWTWFKNNYITAKGKKQKEVLQKEGLTK
ncbi:phage holin [Niallia sp. Krafla_26]|uniref:phage holin n=1 Tax=Niallia sp. Krafla_26 TaxID=3064703 RepID=UPI003D1780BF